MKSTRMSTTPLTVDEYLRPLPAAVRAALTRLRRIIKAAAPEAEERISYQMPAYKLNGPLVYFAAFTHHCSFFPGGKGVLKKFAKELAPFEASGGTIKFTVDHPLPASLVKRIVAARVKENNARQAARAARKRG